MYYFQDLPSGSKISLHLSKDNKFLVLDAITVKYLGNNITIIDIKSPNKDGKVLNFKGVGIVVEHDLPDVGTIRFLKCKIVRHNGAYNLQVNETGLLISKKE